MGVATMTENSRNGSARSRVETRTGRDYDYARSGEPIPRQEESKLPVEVITLFEHRWPACFSVYAKRRRPIAVNIHEHIIAALAGTVSEGDVRRALRVYTKNVSYLKKLKAGKERIGLDGLPNGKVTERNESYARWQINNHYRDEWRKQNASFNRPPPLDPEEDPNGKWASRRHPANAEKPTLSLWPGRRS
jgi:sRNA-binding protein